MRTRPDPRSPGARTSLTEVFAGAPLALPPALDRLAERWSRATPRVRAAMGLGVVVLVVLVAGHGAARSPWGPPLDVVVAHTDLAVGTTIETADVSVASWPRGLLPAGAFDDPAAIVGSTVIASVPAGAVLTSGVVSDGGLGAGLAPGHVAYPLATAASPELVPGQRVDVIGGDGSHGARRLSANAVVIAREQDRVWLQVLREDAPAIAGAAAWGEVTLVILPVAERR